MIVFGHLKIFVRSVTCQRACADYFLGRLFSAFLGAGGLQLLLPVPQVSPALVSIFLEEAGCTDRADIPPISLVKASGSTTIYMLDLVFQNSK